MERDPSPVHPPDVVDRARRLLASGVSSRAVAGAPGIPERTVAHWQRGDRRSGKPRVRPRTCPRCEGLPLDRPSYASLLGSYSGDGHITHANRTACLWIYCDDGWPGIRAEVAAATGAVMPSASVSIASSTGSAAVKSFTLHWLCLFPQHGPGAKHTRRIVLEPWQEEVVDQHTGLFLRGLFHSDGCRITNWTTRRVAGELKRYTYPRYFFGNESADIMGLCAAALDRPGIAWRLPRPTALSVARREAVAALDVHVGPQC